MKINFDKRIIPHIVIVVVVLATCFFTVKPFLANLTGSTTNKTNEANVVKPVNSQLSNLMDSLFQSKQLASLISIGKGLPILEKANEKDSFGEINKDGAIGNVGRRNPFSATEN